MSITLPDFAEVPLASPLANSPEDYDRIRKAVAYITRKAQHQPSLEDIAGHVGLSVSHFHHLFRRWAGITPKDFLAAVTLDRARDLLRDSASILDATYELGLSGPARLHDLFVTHEAMTPGAFKTGGAGLAISYGFDPSPFGTALVMVAPLGLAGVAFADPGEEAVALADMRKRWPNAELREDSMVTAPYAGRIFDPSRWQADRPLNVVMIGTDFEVRVWRTLLKIPMGKATTYGDIASHVGNPKASRAVGAAVGKNPLSFVVPCHRVIGRSGELTGYHWGLTRKQAMLGWEGGRVRSGTEAA